MFLSLMVYIRKYIKGCRVAVISDGGGGEDDDDDDDDDDIGACIS